MKKNQVFLVLLCVISAASLKAQDLYVGSNTSGNTTNFTSGTNSYSNTYIGFATNASSNSLGVFNTNTLLTNSAAVYVGYSGSSNTMIISNGATVRDTTGIISITTNSSNNLVQVTGSNSLWSHSINLFVGSLGSFNTMIISNGATVANTAGTIGNTTSSSNNLVQVTGTNSLWSNSSTLIIGNSGSSNTMIISNGAIVRNTSGTIGSQTNSSNNLVQVTGTNSLWSNSSTLIVGSSGSSNTMTISNGATVRNTSGTIGSQTNSSNNLVQVTGPNSLWTNVSTLTVGNSGSSNTMIISNGATVKNTTGVIGNGARSSNNLVQITGPNSLWSNSTALTIGNGGSFNTMTVSNGSVVVNTVGTISSTTNASNNLVQVTGTGSLWSNANTLYVGDGGSGTLTVANGGSVVATNISIANQTNSSGTLNFGSVGGSDAAGSVVTPVITFGAGAGTINFNQTNSLTITSAITGPGTVQQLGSGTSILTGSNSYTGTTTISNGTLVAASSNAFGTSAVALNGGNLTVSNNLTIASLDWETNSSIITIATPGTTVLNVTGNFTTANQTNYVALGVLDNNTNLIMTSIATNTSLNTVLVEGTTNTPVIVISAGGTNSYYSYIVTNSSYEVTGSQSITNSFTVSNLSYSNNSTLTINTGAVLNVTSNYTSTNSGTLNYQFGSPGDPAGIIVGGTMTLDGTFIGNFVNETPHNGDKRAIAIAGAIDGNFINPHSTEVETNGFIDPLHRGRIIYEGDPVLYEIIAPTSYAQVAQNQNQLKVALALNSFIPVMNGDENTVSLALDQLTDAQYPNAFNQISPALYTSFATMAFNSAVAQYNEMVQRLGNIRVAGVGFSQNGFNDSPIMDDNKNPKAKDILIPSVDNHWGVFVDGNGIFANVNINNQLPGYSMQSGGVTVGGDYK